MVSSIEEQIEDLCKQQLKDIKYYTKTESINEEIEHALKESPSKSGGSGTNYPDIKLFIETKYCKSIPVMIEVKGKKGDFIKLNTFNEIDYDYMEKYITIQQKLAIKNVVDWRDKQIATTKQVVKNI